MSYSIDEIHRDLAETGLWRADRVYEGSDPRGFFNDLSARLGTLLPQYGESVVDIKPKPGAVPFGPFGTGLFPVHNDGMIQADHARPDYVAMFCVNPGEGGEHAVVDAFAVIERLRRDSTLPIDELLARRVQFLRHNDPIPAADNDVVALPVAPASANPANLYKGPIFDRVKRVLRYGKVSMSRVDQRFDEVSRVMEENAHAVERVKPGTVWIVDDRRMLHARRTEIRGNDRLMLRTHIKR